MNRINAPEKNTFKIAFFINKSNIRKKTGKAPIVTRITINGDQAHFNTKYDILPYYWEVQTETAKKPKKISKGQAVMENQIQRLAELSFIIEHKDLFITGSTGTGKTYLTTDLGYEACQKGYRVLYTNTARLMGLLKAARAKGTILSELRKIERMYLLILDDFGMQPFDSTARMNLLDVIEDRYGKKSTIITSQIPVGKWHDWVGDKTVADAVLDRIVHRSLKIELYGESLRKMKL